MKLKDIEFNLLAKYKPNNKRTYFRYDNETNTIIITSPNYVKCKNPESLVLEYEEEIYNFIKKCQTKLKKNNINNDNNIIHFFGKPYKLRTELSADSKVIILNDEIVIYTPSLLDCFVECVLYWFYQKELENYINEILPEGFKMYKNGIKGYKHSTMPQIIYKRVKTFYGKCYTLNNVISLNLILAKYDKLYIKNVLYHELTHFVVPNHSDKFYYIFDICFPHAKTVQKEMKKIHYNDRY